MRVAVLAPISWRVPPRHYGPWEQFASLLTEGLVARGVDVTLFATGDSKTAARLASVAARGWSEDGETADAKVLECLHISAAFERAGEFDLIHNSFDFLPLTYSAFVSTPVLTTIHGFSSPAIVPVYEKYNRRSAYVAISDADRHPRLDYAATIHHGIDTDDFPPGSGDGGYLLFFGRIHPHKGTAEAIEVARRVGQPLVIAGIVQDRDYFDRCVAPHVDDDHVRYLGPVGPDRRAAVLGGADGAAAPHRIRRTVRLQRGGGDGLRHTRRRLRPGFDARARRGRQHRFPRRRRGRGGRRRRPGRRPRPGRHPARRRRPLRARPHGRRVPHRLRHRAAFPAPCRLIVPADPFRLGVNYWPAETAMDWLAAYDPVATRRDFTLARAAGLDSLRIFVRWADIQPAEDTIDGAVLGRVVDAADAADECGLSLIVTLFVGHMSGVNWSPGWAAGGADGDARFRVLVPGAAPAGGRVLRNWYSDPGVVAAQERQARALSSALAGHPAVWLWDLGNENSNCTIPPDVAAGDQWLERLTGALRAGDPGRPITVGIHMEDLENDRRMGPAAVARHCEIVSMHGYPAYTAWADGPTDDRLLPFLALVTGWLAGGTPVLFEEFGLPTGRPGGRGPSRLVEEQAAADYTGRALDGLRDVGCVGALLWCFADYDAGAAQPAAVRRGGPRAELRPVAGGRFGQAGRGGAHRARRPATVVSRRSRRLARHRDRRVHGRPGAAPGPPVPKVPTVRR